MKTRRRITAWLAALLFALVAIGTVAGQDNVRYPPQADSQQTQTAPPPGQNGGAAPGQNAQDPPGRVARLQYTSGEVSMQPGGVNDWVAASLNRPLTTSDRVWTDKDSRAELNVGDGFLRMNSETSLTLTNVSDSTVQLELDQGVLEVTVRHLERGEIYEIDTPNFAFTVMKTGVYRFDVHPNEDQSWVTVRSGYGEATGRGAAVRVNSGQQARFSNANSMQHTAEAAPARDGFDDWVQVRDKRLDSSVSARYVSPGVIGYQDLDAYGTWQTVPTYGAIWIPTSVPAGWAPYRYGHWVWIAPWGWTWVDDAPWGFAPFHYGRWVSWGGGWAWAPGPVGYWNPYYAPALVGWVGGPGFGVGFGFGGAGWGFGISFGWFPLGWGAPYYPHYAGWGYGGWYHGGGWVSNAYLRNVNITNTRITNVTNITNNYYNNNLAGVNGNRNVPGAVTAAPKSAFTSGAQISKVGFAVPKAGLGNGQLLHTADVMPTRQSVLGGNAAARAIPPTSTAGRNVVSRVTPPSGPARFESGQMPAAGNLAGNHGVTAGQNNNAAAGTGVPGHNVPRPPSAGETASNGGPSLRKNFPATTGSMVGSPGTTGSAPRPSQNGNAPGVPERGYASTASGSGSHVPRPPASYSYHAPAVTPHASTPERQSSPRESQGQSSPKASGTTSVARPPSGYTYHAAPAYAASATSNNSRSGYPGGSRPSYSGSSYAGSGRGSSPMTPAAPAYGTGRNSGAAPNYATRSSAPSYSAPRYSAPSAPRYSGGGGGGYRASGSGGGSHSSGGGGHRG